MRIFSFIFISTVFTASIQIQARPIYIQSFEDKTFLCYNPFTRAVYKGKKLNVNCFFYTIPHNGDFILEALASDKPLYLGFNTKKLVILQPSPDISWQQVPLKIKKSVILIKASSPDTKEKLFLSSPKYRFKKLLCSSTNFHIVPYTAKHQSEALFKAWEKK